MILLRFTTVQPHDSVQILKLPVAPLVQCAVDYGIVIPSIDEQHLVLQFLWLSLIKEPQRTGQALCVEEVVAHADHHIHMASFNQFLADVPILAGAVCCGRCHNEARPAMLVQVGVKIGDPQIIGVVVLYVSYVGTGDKVQYFIKPEKGQLTSDHKDLDPAKIISKIEVTLKDRTLTQTYHEE